MKTILPSVPRIKFTEQSDHKESNQALISDFGRKNSFLKIANKPNTLVKNTSNERQRVTSKDKMLDITISQEERHPLLMHFSKINVSWEPSSVNYPEMKVYYQVSVTSRERFEPSTHEEGNGFKIPTPLKKTCSFFRFVKNNFQSAA